SSASGASLAASPRASRRGTSRLRAPPRVRRAAAFCRAGCFAVFFVVAAFLPGRAAMPDLARRLGTPRLSARDPTLAPAAGAPAAGFLATRDGRVRARQALGQRRERGQRIAPIELVPVGD